MAEPAETIIIGGGIAGLAAAYELGRRGQAVTLLEAGPDLGAETSRGPGGIFTPSMPEPWNGPGVAGHLWDGLTNPASAMRVRWQALPSLVGWGLRFLHHSSPSRHLASTVANFHLCHFSTATMKAWRDTHGLQFDSVDAGSLKLFRSRAAMAGPIATARLLAQHGLRFEVLDADETVAREPLLAHVRDEIAGAIFYPDDSRGDSHALCQALAGLARAEGVDIRTNAPVSRILRARGRVRGIEVAGTTLAADHVVVAAATAAPRLLAPLGLRLPVRPAKGYSVTIRIPGDNRIPAIPVIDDAMHAAIIPLGNRIRLAGTAEFAGEDRSIDPTRTDNLKSLLAGVYPDLAADLPRAEVEDWTGLRPMSADGRPFVGETRIPGLWLDTGHGHLGLTMAAGSAVLLADLMEGRTPPIDPAPYSAQRAPLK
jgi:D-amino-acid dehydrogenase